MAEIERKSYINFDRITKFPSNEFRYLIIFFNEVKRTNNNYVCTFIAKQKK